MSDKVKNDEKECAGCGCKLIDEEDFLLGLCAECRGESEEEDDDAQNSNF